MGDQTELFVPDRFDMLKRKASGQLSNIVIAVDSALAHVKSLHRDMRAAGRGSFLIFRGQSGSGKSTFLNTIGLFLEGVSVLTIERAQNIESEFRTLPAAVEQLRIVIIEGRDALREVTSKELEAAVHEVNAFLRSDRGEKTLVVWPVNADDLETALVTVCNRVGGDALLGVGNPSYRFNGPPKQQFLDIASRTIATLNQGASLADLGVSDDRAIQLTRNATTIGQFLGLLRQDLIKNQHQVESLLDKERCRLWIVVAAANDPEGDVAGLTRGTASAADIGRLIGATNANIVRDLKEFPDKLGILGAVLDAKILHLPAVTALAVAREFADQKLAEAMTLKGLSVAGKWDAISRIKESDLGRAFAGDTMGTRTRGPKPGSNTVDAFEKIANIAAQNDIPLNDAIGKALKSCGFATDYHTEKNLGGGLSRYSDLLCETLSGPIRLEFMWRSKTGRADIANYALSKLYNYGRAIGFLV